MEAMLDLLHAILRRHASDEANAWLDDFIPKQRAEFGRRPFYYAFSGATRRFSKERELEVTEAECAELNFEAAGFRIDGWTADRLARVVLLILLGERPKPTFLDTVNALFETADLREQAAIFAAFPALPHAENLVPIAREGLRTNIVDVFDSIALDNPFPAEHFDDEGWNQMVLKCLFIDRPLFRVHRIEQRANPTLVEQISNLAHERWAAGRTISPEAWRSCQDFLSDQIVKELTRVAASEEPGHREAAALIFAREGGQKLAALKPEVEQLLGKVESGELTWESLGTELFQS
ncbi:MAG: hypothetical protein ACI8UO_004506 [Verrucomicrobiales bacterium]